MIPTPLFRRLRSYPTDRRLAASWLTVARAAMQSGQRARALRALRHYRAAKSLMQHSWHRWISSVPSHLLLA